VSNRAGRRIAREWQKRRRKESYLLARASAEKGVPVSTLLRLNKMTAEDIREVRSHSISWLRAVMGNDRLTPEDREALLAQLENAYLRSDAGIEKAVRSMREHGMKDIPREQVERYLKPAEPAAASPSVDDAH
jgi:hypothetical protein